MDQFDCPICFNSYSVNDGCICCTDFNREGKTPWNHGICVDCIRGLAKAATTDAPIARGGIGLPCPVSECDNAITIESFQFYLDPDVHKVLMKRLQHEAILEAGLNDLVICSKCETEVEVDRSLDFFDCQCGRRQCRTCPRIYDDNHKGVSCAELNQRLIPTLEAKLSEITIRTCYRCNLLFKKESGCNKITCRCGAKQCYLCRQAVEDYSHFCECGWKETSGKCPRCHKSCPLFGDPEERDRIQMEEVIAAFNAMQKSTSPKVTKLFVKNFGEELNNKKLFNLFKKYGKIIYHKIMRDSDGKSSGFGLVAFADADAAEVAIRELNGYVLPSSQNKLYVTIAQTKAERQAEFDQSVNVYVTNLHDSVTDDELLKYFQTFGRIISAKVVRDENRQCKNFGFVRFVSPEVAETTINNLHKREVLISEKLYIKKAQKKSEREAERNQSINLYVKNLDNSITENDLLKYFQQFDKIIDTKILRDKDGRSKNSGFVRFSNPAIAETTINNINGSKVPISKRLFIEKARTKAERKAMLDKVKSTKNNNLHIKNLDKSLDNIDLQIEFARFGKIISTKVIRDNNGLSKGFGFVCFEDPNDAARAILHMNGKVLRSKIIHVSLDRKKEEKVSQPWNDDNITRANDGDVLRSPEIVQPQILLPSRPISPPRLQDIEYPDPIHFRELNPPKVHYNYNPSLLQIRTPLRQQPNYKANLIGSQNRDRNRCTIL